MFKKQLADIKTSATLKNSDRKKLRQRILQEYFDSAEATTEVGDLLVPEGLQSVRFTTSGGEPGLAYLSAEGDPLWFSLGKGNADLIPTVYTLWKRPRLLPYLSTPAAVIPVLQNGADLMAAGVVEMLGTPNEGQLVSITQYVPGAIGPPLAVGRMATPGTRVREGDLKGKAVSVLHLYKDKLWEMGGKTDPPEPELRIVQKDDESEKPGREEEKNEVQGSADETVAHSEAATPPPTSETEEPEAVDGDVAATPLDPQDVSSILRTSLIQAIKSTLGPLPQGSFPILSTILYSEYILPSRPGYLPSVSNSFPPSSSTPIDIKHSASKNLTSFLKGLEKEGLLKIKEQRGKGGAAGEVQVLSVNPGHPDVMAHRAYKTVGDVEAKKRKERQAEKERKKEAAEKRKEIGATRLWKPHQQSIRLFEVLGKDSTALYTREQLKETLNAYIESFSLVNRNQRQFININDLLRDVLATKGADVPEFMKREDLLKRLVEKMQAWYRIEVDGKDPVLKKGKLHPIQIAIKLRQGRKACTFVTQFEPFQLNADILAEELRKVCASSTSVNPLPGSAAGLEVMVQGRQTQSVRELLMSKGVPKNWIVESDLTTGKK